MEARCWRATPGYCRSKSLPKAALYFCCTVLFLFLIEYYTVYVYVAKCYVFARFLLVENAI